MKRVLYLVPALLVMASVSFSQQPPAAGGQKIGLSTSLKNGYAGFKRNFTAAAEKMPEADYTFKPGSTPEARTYAAVIAHIAQAQFGQCSNLTGEPNPMAGKQLEQELKTKAEVTKALADSFALCDKAFDMLTDQNALEVVQMGQRQLARAAALANNVSHDNEMYGTSAAYLRTKGIVPPSSTGWHQSRRDGGGSR